MSWGPAGQRRPMTFPLPVGSPCLGNMRPLPSTRRHLRLAHLSPGPPRAHRAKVLSPMAPFLAVTFSSPLGERGGPPGCIGRVRGFLQFAGVGGGPTWRALISSP